MRRARIAFAASACCLLLSASSPAQAPGEPARLQAFGRSIAGTDDTTAIVQNPANLGFLPGAEFRWDGAYALKETMTAPYRGHAFGFGFRLPFSLATGLRLDFVDPPAKAFGGALSQNYQWLTWGLAIAASESFSIGASLQRSFSHGPVADGLSSFSLAASLRPSTLFGLSVVAHHVNSPIDHAGERRLAALGAPNVSLAPSLSMGLALRPLGTRQLELGLETRYFLDPQIWQPRVTLGIGIPGVGRLRGEFMVDDMEKGGRLDVRGAASLAVFLNNPGGSAEVDLGGTAGSALGPTDAFGLYNSVAFRGFRERHALPTNRLAVRVRLESTPDNRGHVTLLRKLWALAREPEVAAVAFELRDSPGSSLAHIQELRDAVALLRANGKKTLCHLEDAGGGALYFCAATDRILVNPAGGLRFAGLRTRHFYVANLLSSLGIAADFVRVGEHKSAPEQFTRNDASETARADVTNLLQQNELWFAGDIAHDRKIPVELLRERIAKGPFIAEEARSAGLVDGPAFDDQIEDAVTVLTGEAVSLTELDRAPYAPERFAKQKSVALVYVDGDIIDGRSRTIPLLGIELAGSYTIAETMKRVRQNPVFGAVVLRIESPGGSSMASDVMWREIALTAKVKPVIVSMGGIAASGGYYIAAPGTRIFANPLTLTGSIGVFYGKADVSGLIRKIGLSAETYKTAPRADVESFFRPFTPSEREELVRKVNQFYGVFVSRVADGRHMTKAAVDAVGQGRVFTGDQAKARGLVDELGGIRQALAEARRSAGLRDDAPVVELPKIETSFIGQLLGIPGLHAAAEKAGLPEALLRVAREMAPFMVHAADRPLARIEITNVEP